MDSVSLRLDAPALVWVTARGLKDYGDGTRQAGRAIGPLAIIHPDYAGDIGLLEHEKEHVEQWLLAGALAAALAAIIGSLAALPDAWLAGLAAAGFAAHPLAYALVPAYRLWAEVAAYRVQAGWYVDDRRLLFARFIAERYRLDVSAAEALARLRS